MLERSCRGVGKAGASFYVKTLLVLLLSSAGSYCGWWLGTPFGLFGRFVLSMVGFGVGMWYGARLAARFEG